MADPEAPKPVIRVMAYRAGEHLERAIGDAEEIRGVLAEWPVTWVNVDGLGDAAVVAKIGEILGLHRLALEDVLNTRQRAKVDTYGDAGQNPHLYIVTREVLLNEELLTDQISMFLGRNYVVTFQERAGDCLDPVRERIRHSDRFRGFGADWLAYAILDAVVDGYFPVMEQVGERLQTLEDEVVMFCDERSLRRIHDMKRDLLTLRRAIWPERDAINQLLRDANPLITDATRLYMRDCYDHVVQLLDMVETYRELGADLMDVYLSSVSNRLNSVMKVLTIIATLFMPLSFIAGVWGMNFNTAKSPWNMPELNWYFGYPMALGVMLLVTVVMLLYFRRAGWIGGGRRAAAGSGLHVASGEGGPARGGATGAPGGR